MFIVGDYTKENVSHCQVLPLSSITQERYGTVCIIKQWGKKQTPGNFI